MTYVSSDTDYDYLFKIVIIGDAAVGKSNLLLRYTQDSYNPDMKSTIGVEFATRSVEVGGEKIKAQLWDTAGAERYRALTSAYYRRAAGALIVYDVTSKASFESVERWVHEVREHAESDVVVVLAGNKCDVGEHEREVSTTEGVSLAARLGMPFLETSALDSTNVEQAFHALLVEVHKSTKRKDVAPRPDRTVLRPIGDVVRYEQEENASESKCCLVG